MTEVAVRGESSRAAGSAECPNAPAALCAGDRRLPVGSNEACAEAASAGLVPPNSHRVIRTKNVRHRIAISPQGAQSICAHSDVANRTASPGQTPSAAPACISSADTVHRFHAQRRPGGTARRTWRITPRRSRYRASKAKRIPKECRAPKVACGKYKASPGSRWSRPSRPRMAATPLAVHTRRASIFPSCSRKAERLMANTSVLTQRRTHARTPGQMPRSSLLAAPRGNGARPRRHPARPRHPLYCHCILRLQPDQG